MAVRILLRIAGEVIPHRRTHTGIGAVLGWCSPGPGNYWPIRPITIRPINIRPTRNTLIHWNAARKTFGI